MYTDIDIDIDIVIDTASKKVKKASNDE